MTKYKPGIFTPISRQLWAHEIRVAEILAQAGHYVEFLEERHRIPTADICLDGIEYEIKSPEAFNPNTIEHTIRNALKQSSNIIIDTSRLKKIRDTQICNFLTHQSQKYRQIKRMLVVTKRGKIIEIVGRNKTFRKKS